MTSAAILRHLALGLAVALLSAIVVRVMIALRVMDTPEARKAHDRPTPKGGGVGIVAGLGISLAASAIAGWPISISFTAIAVGFLFSVIIGVFFGYYPALKASRLNVIDALRFE